jgi:predicted DNA-binding protein (MmcQ/YjbR family)
MAQTSVALRRWAMAEPGVTEDVACKGTALESTSYKLGGRAFLFVQRKSGALVLRLKLAASADAAVRAGGTAGAHGWVTLTVPASEPAAALQGWVHESRELVAGAKPASAKATTSAKKAKPSVKKASAKQATRG